MLKLLNKIWVKFVNKWRLNNSKTSDKSPTVIQLIKKINNNCSKLININKNTNYPYTLLSTIKFNYLNLLNKSFTHHPQDLLI